MKFNHINRRIEDFNGVERLNRVIDSAIEEDYRKKRRPVIDGKLLFEPLSASYATGIYVEENNFKNDLVQEFREKHDCSFIYAFRQHYMPIRILREVELLF